MKETKLTEISFWD